MCRLAACNTIVCEANVYRMRGVEPRSLDPDPTATATYHALTLGAIELHGSTASLEVVRLMEEQGEEWQTAAQLRELASVKELERDIVKVQNVDGHSVTPPR